MANAKFGLDPSLVGALHRATSGDIRLGAHLSNHSRWKIGGPAAAMVTVNDPYEVKAVAQLMHGRPEPMMVVGQAANILFDSAGYSGVILRLGAGFEKVSVHGNTLTAGGATSVRDVVRVAIGAGLKGIEHAIGIPGTIAGLVVMNGGTQRKSIGKSVEEVLLLDCDQIFRTCNRTEAGFAYRTSSFQNGGRIVLEVKFALESTPSARLRAEAEKILVDRAQKFPEDEANCGSTFLSSPQLFSLHGPPGYLIESSGFKGFRIGGAEVSIRHANFINNIGGATSADVLRIIWEIRREIYLRTGFLMDCEVRYVSSGGDIVPAHIAAEWYWGPVAGIKEGGSE